MEVDDRTVAIPGDKTVARQCNYLSWSALKRFKRKCCFVVAPESPVPPALSAHSNYPALMAGNEVVKKVTPSKLSSLILRKPCVKHAQNTGGESSASASTSHGYRRKSGAKSRKSPGVSVYLIHAANLNMVFQNYPEDQPSVEVNESMISLLLRLHSQLSGVPDSFDPLDDEVDYFVAGDDKVRSLYHHTLKSDTILNY